MTHASESGHWYSRTGEPVYTVKAKDGTDRPATLADARKLNLVPGVSGIINCAAKPGLIRWQQEQVLHAALTLPVVPGESEKNYLARILDDAREQARKAAARGTAIHTAIQGHFEGQAPDPEYWPYVRAAVDSIRDRYGNDMVWVAERSFCSPLGYGGKIDLHSDSVLLDFKTKEFTEPVKLAWPEQCMQLEAYNRGLAPYIGVKTLANVFVSTKIPGLVHVHEWGYDERQRAWDKFSALLAYWKADRGFESGWKHEASGRNPDLATERQDVADVA